MFVKIIKSWMGQNPGQVIDVSEPDAKHLIGQGIAEEVKGNPLDEVIGRTLGEAVGRLTAQLEKAVEENLKSFAAAQRKSRKNATPLIFGEAGEGDPQGKTFGDWLLACRSKNYKRLEEYGSQYVDWAVPGETKAALNTQTGTQGGFTVPAEFLPRLMQLAAENAIVRTRATIIPMTGKTIHVPCLDVTTAQSAGTTAFLGGLKATWTEEAATETESEPTFKQVELTAWELSGYSKISNALMADNAIGLDTLLMTLFGKAIGWYEDYAFLRGTGAGQPLGVITWAGLISVARSAASAFGLADYAGMMARWLHNADPQTSCWVCHPTVLAKLYQLGDAAGNLVFATNVNDRPKLMLGGLPVEVTEKVPALNTAGDIGLYDFSKYLIGDRQQVEIAFSEHYAFINNQGVWRFVSRVGGRPWMNDKVTLADASNTLSPFVGLAAG